MFKLSVKFPLGAKMELGEFREFAELIREVENFIKVMEAYESCKRAEKAKREVPSFHFTRRVPRPGVIELYEPLTTQYREYANMRAMFISEEREDAVSNNHGNS